MRRTAWLLSLILAVCLPGVITFAVLARTINSIPYIDDYETVLDFANRYFLTTGFIPSTLLIVRETHVQYKLWAHSLIVATEVSAFGGVHILWIIWIGNLCLALIALALWLMTPGTSLPQRLLRFLPCSLLVFALRHNEASNWATGALQVYGVVAFVLLSFWFFEREGWLSFAGGCLSVTLAVACSSNGFLAVAIGVLLLAQRRRYAPLGVLIALGTVLLRLYLYGMAQTPPILPVEHVPHWVLFAFPIVFVGALTGHLAPSFVLGLLLIAAIVMLAWHERSWRLTAVRASILFVLVTSVAVSWARYQLGFSGAASSRYGIYAQVLVALIFLECQPLIARMSSVPMQRQRVRMLSAGFIVLCGLYFAYATRVGWRISGTRAWMSAEHMLAWEQGDPQASLYAVDEPSAKAQVRSAAPELDRMLRESIRLKLYEPPTKQELQRELVVLRSPYP